jgi:glycosyltransferase involved in cell wall biosynthesis
VVIPTYNERENIGVLLKRVLEVASTHRLNLDILVVDDNSPDGTGNIVEECSKKMPRIHLLRRPGKLGLGSAYKDGFRKAIEELEAEILVEMDADGSHNPKYLPAIVGKILEGYDVVVGSRYIPGGSIQGWRLRRKLTSSGANFLARRLCGIGVKDSTSGYRAFKAEALKRIGLERVSSSGYAFQVEMLFWTERLGLKVGETPIAFIDRVRARSKLGLKEMVKFIGLCLRLFFKRLPR